MRETKHQRISTRKSEYPNHQAIWTLLSYGGRNGPAPIKDKT